MSRGKRKFRIPKKKKSPNSDKPENEEIKAAINILNQTSTILKGKKESFLHKYWIHLILPVIAGTILLVIGKNFFNTDKDKNSIGLKAIAEKEFLQKKRGVVTLDDFLSNDSDEDSILYRSKFCQFLEREHLSITEKPILKLQDNIKYSIEKYFGRGLAEEDITSIAEDSETFSIKIDYNSPGYIDSKLIEIHKNEIKSGYINNDDFLDYVIPFYTSGGGNYYYYHLLFIINEKNKSNVFRNCRLEMDNYRFSILRIKNNRISVVTINHKDEDAWMNPTQIDTVQLVYFNDKVQFTKE